MWKIWIGDTGGESTASAPAVVRHVGGTTIGSAIAAENRSHLSIHCLPATAFSMLGALRDGAGSAI
jgi:hypothetical protein